jgi:heptosyltransferase-2
MKRILIIQTAFIGDVILTTPLIQRLHDAFPNCLIDFLTIEKSMNILENNPALNEIILFNKHDADSGIKGLLRMGKVLAGKAYDLCIVPHRSLRSAFLAWRTKATVRIGFDRSAWKSAFSVVIPYQPDRHEIERNLSLLAPLGITRQISMPLVYPSAEDKEIVEKLLSSVVSKKNDLFVAVAPGSVWSTKRWPATYFATFCRILNSRNVWTILIGSKEDADLCQSISNDLKRSFSAAGKLSLRQTYDLLTRCRSILTNDSAPLHLGMAAGISVFAIFGPTVPAFGFAPFGGKGFIIENQAMTCRPCSIHGGNTCPIKTFECMKSLKPEQIAAQVLSNLLPSVEEQVDVHDRM